MDSEAAALLQPLVALVLWTFVMEFWMYATRIPALNKARENNKLDINPNMTREHMNSAIPRHVQWKADNYNHLMEQPTVFYAIVIAMVHVGSTDTLSKSLAWGYVALRMVHSVVQASVNNIRLRFTIFATSSIVLFALSAKAAMVVF